MARKPSNHQKPWTPDEVSTLKRLFSEGIPLRTIAMEMGRTPESVKQRGKTEKATRKTPAGP